MEVSNLQGSDEDPQAMSHIGGGAAEALKGLPRKARKKMKKKLKRKQQRQALAKEALARECHPALVAAQAEEEARAKLREAEEAAERRRQQEAWEEAERRAQAAFQARLAKEAEERRQRELKQAEEQRRRETREKERLERQAQAEALHYGPAEEDDESNCSYYMKTGACRFGTRCKWRHPIPARSTTILIRNMYDGLGIVGHRVSDEDFDDGLDHDEDKLMEDYREFFYDVEPECRQYGELLQFKVCRNRGPHLRGNLYVQFHNVEDAERAARAMHERYYGGKQIFVQFSPVTSWRTALCGQYVRGECSRGGDCNYLHPFRNPGNAYAAEREFWQQPRERRDQSWREDDKDTRRSPSRGRDDGDQGQRGSPERRREPASTRWGGSRRRSRTRSRSRERHKRRRHRSRSRSRSSRERSESRHRRRGSGGGDTRDKERRRDEEDRHDRRMGHKRDTDDGRRSSSKSTSRGSKSGDSSSKTGREKKRRRRDDGECGREEASAATTHQGDKREHDKRKQERKHHHHDDAAAAAPEEKQGQSRSQHDP